jgi:hypothetical protein
VSKNLKSVLIESFYKNAPSKDQLLAKVRTVRDSIITTIFTVKGFLAFIGMKGVGAEVPLLAIWYWYFFNIFEVWEISKVLMAAESASEKA